MHPQVTGIVDTYLAAADILVPGLVEGLYLEGSVALGDFRPGVSDIDFVAVTADRPDAVDLAGLARVHAVLPRRPYFDGVYLTRAELASGPAGPVPGAHEGRFVPAGRGPHDPVTWHTLARHGIACRGPAPAGLDIWTDPAALAAWTDANLDSYWRGWVRRASVLASGFGLYSMTGPATVWVTTGVSRLHYTLATGEITSKTGAARYALDTFPARWHRVLNEALRLRSGAGQPSYAVPLRRRRDALSFAELVIADAHRLHSGRSG